MKKPPARSHRPRHDRDDAMGDPPESRAPHRASSSASSSGASSSTQTDGAPSAARVTFDTAAVAYERAVEAESRAATVDTPAADDPSTALAARLTVVRAWALTSLPTDQSVWWAGAPAAELVTAARQARNAGAADCPDPDAPESARCPHCHAPLDTAPHAPTTVSRADRLATAGRVDAVRAWATGDAHNDPTIVPAWWASAAPADLAQAARNHRASVPDSTCPSPD